MTIVHSSWSMYLYIMSDALAFDILIPTWNNLPFLKCCIESIRKNSALNHRILVFVNEGSDASIQWLQDEKIEFLSSTVNIGICKAINRLLDIANADWVLYLNDDMYVLPGWDIPLTDAIPDEKYWMLSATMLEPRNTGNPCVVVYEAGSDPQSLKEESLINNIDKLKREDWSGSSWPPLLMSRQSWIDAGGLSEEFSPGMYSDPDLSMKMWQLGCRYYRGVGSSLVYHFQAKSTGRIKKNNGRRQFMKKWNLSAAAFYKYYLRMGQTFSGPLENPGPNPFLALNKLRVRLMNLFR